MFMEIDIYSLHNAISWSLQLDVVDVETGDVIGDVIVGDGDDAVVADIFVSVVLDVCVVNVVDSPGSPDIPDMPDIPVIAIQIK